jgi:hypothetical protein
MPSDLSLLARQSDAGGIGQTAYVKQRTLNIVLEYIDPYIGIIESIELSNYSTDRTYLYRPA